MIQSFAKRLPFGLILRDVASSYVLNWLKIACVKYSLVSVARESHSQEENAMEKNDKRGKSSEMSISALHWSNDNTIRYVCARMWCRDRTCVVISGMRFKRSKSNKGLPRSTMGSGDPSAKRRMRERFEKKAHPIDRQLVSSRVPPA